MTELYQILQYNFDDPNGSVKDFSTDAIAHLDSIPSMIEDWQSQDIANNSVNGYLKNPVSNVTANISSSSNNIINVLDTGTSSNAAGIFYVTTDVLGTTPAISNVFQDIITVSGSLITQNSNANTSFKSHTDRVSGLTNYTDYLGDPATLLKPFYITAMGYGKVAVYILYQTDGISNSSVVLGSFTSLLIKPQLEASYNLITTYANTINSSITVTSSGTGLSNSPFTTTRTSNLSSLVVTAMYNELANTNTLMDTRRTHDETYYTNLKTLVTDYNTVRQFSQMGETQLDLVNNHIGTDKLLSRIN
jgi:hypothetical protein